MPDDVLVKFTGRNTEIMCQVNKSYNQYMVHEGKKKRPVLYMRLHKALYGCMQSALLWYRTYRDELINLGFKTNKYDPCVANAIIEGSQATIC